MLTRHRGAVVRVTLLAIGSNCGYWVGLIFMNAYLTKELGYSTSGTFWIMAGISYFVACLMPFFGGLSDRWGRKKVIAIGFTGYAVLVIPTMLVMGLGSFPLAVAAMVVLALPMPIVQAVTYPTYAELFPTRVRYTGLSISFNLGTIVGGGLTPYLATWLTSTTGNLLAPGYLLMAAAVIALLTLRTVAEPSRGSRHDGHDRPTAPPRTRGHRTVNPRRTPPPCGVRALDRPHSRHPRRLPAGQPRDRPP